MQQGSEQVRPAVQRVIRHNAKIHRTRSVTALTTEPQPVTHGVPMHSVAECQFSTNLIITFDRNKIQTSKWYHFVSLVKAIRMTYNKALTHQVMTLIRGIFKFTTSLYDLK